MDRIGGYYSNYSQPGTPYTNYASKNSKDYYSIAAEEKRHKINNLMDGLDTNRASNMYGINSILASSRKSVESLRMQRQSRGDTALEIKHMKYQFKNISSKLIRSKTSSAARQVANEAKREVARLKRERDNNESDSKDIDAAIAHAKAIERVARKKVKHLEEEERAKISGGICADERIESEEDEESEDKIEDEALLDEELEDLSEVDFETIEEQEEIAMEDIPVEDIPIEDMLSEDMMNMMSDLFENYSEEFKDMMSELGIDELFDSDMSAKDLDPSDLKEMIVKHRNKEMKDIVKADSEYLKAVFKNYQEMLNSGQAPNQAPTQSAPVQEVSFSNMGLTGFDISV